MDQMGKISLIAFLDNTGKDAYAHDSIVILVNTLFRPFKKY